MNSNIAIGDMLEYRSFDAEVQVHALFYVCILYENYICGTYIRQARDAPNFRVETEPTSASVWQLNKVSVQRNTTWTIDGINTLIQSGHVTLYKRKPNEF